MNVIESIIEVIEKTHEHLAKQCRDMSLPIALTEEMAGQLPGLISELSERHKTQLKAILRMKRHISEFMATAGVEEKPDILELLEKSMH